MISRAAAARVRQGRFPRLLVLVRERAPGTRRVLLLAAAGLISTPTAAGELLHAGPMLGYADLREVGLWVQTTRAAEVQVRYFPEAAPDDSRLTPSVRSRPEEDHAVTLRLADLVPGTRYRYELYLDGGRVSRPYPLGFSTRPLWEWRTEAPDFTLMVGSCAYVNEPEYDRPGRPYGGGYGIFGVMASLRADLMLWLGDNVYTREVDYGTGSGFARRYRHHRGLPELQPLLAAAPNYAIWDDHDFGPNDSDASYALKDAALSAFARYWPAVRYGLPETPGTFQRVSWSDVDFFLLDDRFYRKPKRWPDGPDKRMLGAAQLDWLQAALLASEATFRVVAIGSQALNPSSPSEGLVRYPHEQRALIDWIRSQRIEGVLFLSGDRHHTELIRLETQGSYPLYDFTSSPLTAGTRTMTDTDGERDNPHRVPGTLLTERSFGLVRFEGAKGERRVVLRALDASGRVRWEHAIRRSELSFPK